MVEIPKQNGRYGFIGSHVQRLNITDSRFKISFDIEIFTRRSQYQMKLCQRNEEAQF